MKILNLKAQNILVFGNKFLEIDYQKLGNGSMNLIIGKNGCGKSSFIKLHKLALYFEADGLTMDSVANDINGNGFLSITVESYGHIWRIESDYTRTKLSTIRVYKDENKTPEDWGKIPDTKKMINSQIIDIPYHIFSNILSLSINDFKSFLSMNPKDTRNIRDRIFGFYVLNEMNEKLKLDVKSYNENWNNLKIKITSSKEYLGKLEDDLKSEKEEYKKNSNERKLEIEQKLENAQNLLNQYQNDIDANLDKIKNCQLRLSQITNNNIVSSIEKTEKTLSELTATEQNSLSELEILRKKVEDLREDEKTYSKKQSLIIYNDSKKNLEFLTTHVNHLLEEHENIQNKISDTKQQFDYYTEGRKLNSIIDDYNVDLMNLNLLVIKRQSCVDSLSEITSIIEKTETEINDLQSSINEIEKKRIDLKKSLDLYEKGKCPTCGNDFTTPDFEKIKEDINIELDTVNTKLSEYSLSYDSLTKTLQSQKEECLSLHSSLIKSEKEIDSELNNLSLYKIKISEIILPCNHEKKEFLLKSIDDILVYKNNSTNTKEINQNIDIISEKIQQFKISFAEHDIAIAENNYNSIISEEEKFSNKISEIKTEIRTNEEIIKKYSQEKISLIESLSYKIKEINENNYSELSEEIKSENSKSLSLQDKCHRISLEINDYKNKISALKVQLLSDTLFDSIPEDYKNKSQEEINTLIKEITDDNIKFQEKITSIKTLQSDFRVELQSMKKISEANIKQIEANIEYHKEEIEKLSKEEKKIIINLQFLKIIECTLSDEGIKSFIIKKIVPSINKNIAEILSQLEIPLLVRFDNEFKPTVYRYGNAVQIQSISTGQRKMIDAAIIFTITKFLLSKCGGMNIVFYDEIFSSLHVSAISTMMEIISKELVEKMGLHVFLVNHSFVSSAYFNNIFELVYKNHFSTMTQKTIEQYNKEQLTL